LFDQRITQALQAGILTTTDVEIMKGQKIPDDAKGRTYGERYEARFAKMQRQVSAESRKIFQESEAERLTEAKQAEQTVVDAFIDKADTDGFTDDQIDDFMNLIRKKYNYDPTELALLKKSSVDSKIRKVQEEQIDGLMAMNLLTPERLKQFDPKLQKKYRSQAQAQANLRKENGDFKVQETAIEDMVEHPVTSLGGIVKNHPNVGLMVAKQKRRFHEILAAKALAGETDPVNSAFAQVKYEFENGGYFKENGDPRSGVLDAGNPYAGVVPTFNPASQQANVREIARINGVLKLGKNALNLPDDGMNVVLFNKAQLEAMEKGYGEEGWSPSPAVEYAADILDMDPLSLINQLRETNGMEALPATPAYEVIHNQLTPTQQRLRRQFKTPERTNRALTAGLAPERLSDLTTFRKPILAYISGNIGPTSTGPHLDVKEVGGGNFSEDALDEFVEVDDPEFGRVSLGEIRKLTNGLGDNQDEHRARGSHGVDYGLHSGTKVFVKNGAKIIGTTPSENGDVLTIELPNGKQYTMIHGKSA